MTAINHRATYIAVALIALFVLGLMSLSIVPETRQAILLSYGEVDGTVNRYQDGQRFGSDGAGLILRIPFVQQIQFVDKRVRSVPMDQIDVLSTDQLRLSVDAFARYRIVDPVRMFRTIRTEANLDEQLKRILVSAVYNEMGKKTFATLLSPERTEVMSDIRAALEVEAAKYGAKIIDVRIMRAELPAGTPLESAYQRMRTARNQEAVAIQAEGQKEAQIIRADADAEAARIYADSYGKDPKFYDFYRAMQSYRTTFAKTKGNGSTRIILSPDNDYLRNFRNGGASR